MERFINYSLFGIVFILLGLNYFIKDYTDLYPIQINGKYGFIDKKGQEKIDVKYDAIIDTGEKYIAVYFDDKWGFINKKGEIVITPQYTYTEGFHNGLAYVVTDKFEGYINLKGKYVWKQALKEEQNYNTVTPQQNEPVQPKQAAPKPIKNDFADKLFEEMGI